MKNICLWINGVKVYDVNGITDNFNITDVRGYYLGGSLIPWLESREEYEKAAMLKSIPSDADVDRVLYEIFDRRYAAPNYHRSTAADKNPPRDAYRSFNGSMKSSSLTVNGSRISGSYNIGSFTLGSFGSFRFFTGSYRYEYEYEYEFGSYFKGSFAKYLSSFNISSFFLGSFLSGSFTYDDFLINGKFDLAAPVIKNLSSEPLNRFGYGIHII